MHVLAANINRMRTRRIDVIQSLSCSANAPTWKFDLHLMYMTYYSFVTGNRLEFALYCKRVRCECVIQSNRICSHFILAASHFGVSFFFFSFLLNCDRHRIRYTTKLKCFTIKCSQIKRIIWTKISYNNRFSSHLQCGNLSAHFVS